MAGLESDHVNNNLFDQLDELRRRLDGLERSALRGAIGPYVPDETTTITGYLNLLIHEDGIPAEYRLAIAETYATEPVEVSGIVPIGGIIAWSGTVNNVPTHWALCDGGSGTPDLRDRFILGAGITYAVGATGGAATVDASHSHAAGTLVAAVGAHHHHTSDLAATSVGHTHGSSGLSAAVGAHHHHNSTLAADSVDHSHDDGSLVADVGAHHHHNSTLAADSVGHTHAAGTLAAAVGAHHHHTSDLAATSVGHTHGGGSLTTSNDTHSHLVSGYTGQDPTDPIGHYAETSTVLWKDPHTHSVSITSGEYTHNHGIASGATASDSHGHAITGEVGGVQSPSTGAVSGSTNNTDHDHSISGEVGGIQGASSGSVTGNTGTTGHGHSVSGEVGAIQGASSGAVSGSTDNTDHGHAITGEVGAIQDASTGAVSGSSATGGSATEANMPPYYVLVWIMRIS